MVQMTDIRNSLGSSIFNGLENNPIPNHRRYTAFNCYSRLEVYEWRREYSPLVLHPDPTATLASRTFRYGNLEILHYSCNFSHTASGTSNQFPEHGDVSCLGNGRLETGDT